MKKVLLTALFLAMGFCAFASPYVGVNQGLGAASLELGYLTSSFEENISVGVPSLMAMDTYDANFYKTIVVGADIFFRFRPLGFLVLGIGPTFRAGFEIKGASTIMVGPAVQLSLELPNQMNILYLEVSYIPDAMKLDFGTPSNDLLGKATDQILRFGWRHAF
ncbi:hypothetical protein [uncultured Sphaerochaeta sp.]|uniref:hypothetical protein n=1 Tax=uncultured Sphaerochaeta sp. TaxID=886478 RepID=UPI002A0A482B|nr:hypothetical protein [uncultured Sphaerochaeta sp.]